MENTLLNGSSFFQSSHEDKLPSIYALQDKGYKVLPADRIRRTRIQPLNKTSFSPGETIRIDLPNGDEWIDLRKANLNFCVTLTGSDGTFRRVRKYIHSVFQRCRIEWGSSEIVNVEAWNRYNALKKELFNMKKFNPTDNEEVYLQGGGDGTARSAEGATKTQYIMDISDDFLTKRVYPVGHMAKSSQISIYLDIDSLANIIETDGTINNQSLSISDFYLWYDSYNYNSSMRAEVSKNIAARGLNVIYDTVDYHSQNVPANSTSLSYDINAASRSVNTFLGTFSQTDERGDPSVDDEFINTKPFTISKLQFNSQGHTFPEIPYTTQKELYQENLRSSHRWNFRHGPDLHYGIVASTFLTTKAHIFWDFRHHSDSELLSTGLDNNGARHLLRLEVDMASIGSDPYTFHGWVMHTRRVMMQPGGQIDRLK